MNYTHLVLFGLGLLGILLHNLMKMDEINKKSEGNINLAKYWAIERFAVAVSVIVVVVCVMISQEIKQLHDIGNWLGLAFVSIGYMAQSIVIKVRGKAEKLIQ